MEFEVLVGINWFGKWFVIIEFALGIHWIGKFGCSLD